ncbi:AsmA family protein [Escherichia coli]|nr:AsmA family protein [Escherichia coli]
MKFIGKLLLYILIALLVVIAGLYFLLQTRWGAEHISAWVSENSDYHLAFGAMDHRFSAPSHIVLENVTFGRDGQPATLVAKSVDIALSSRQLTEYHPAGKRDAESHRPDRAATVQSRSSATA